MRRICVFNPQRHGSFGQCPAGTGVSCLGM